MTPKLHQKTQLKQLAKNLGKVLPNGFQNRIKISEDSHLEPPQVISTCAIVTTEALTVRTAATVMHGKLAAGKLP